MEYRTLGRTGVKVNPLCLGTMMFGAWGNTDHEESVRIIHRALDAGINFVDTADVYSQGESEEIVGRALQGRRDSVVLATKVHGKMGDDPNQQGNSRRWIIKEVESSLRRLKTDWIDLYQIHRPDPSIDIADTLHALDDLITQGKIRYAGSSTFPAAEIVEADVLPICQRYDMGVLTWSKLASMAEEAGLSLIHLAIAFAINHPAVTSAIIGPRTMEQLESQLGAADVKLEAGLLDGIDAVVPPGTTVAAADVGWQNPSLAAAARRRA